MERRVEETTLRVKPTPDAFPSPSTAPRQFPSHHHCLHISSHRYSERDAEQDNKRFVSHGIQNKVTMSSPSHRRQRSSQSGGTPKRSSRQSEAATPRNTRASQLASSPMFFQSSSPGLGGSDANQDVSSPLRQMSNSQSTHQQTAVPSSPLGQMTDSQSTDGQRTPRASGMAAGGESIYQT